jgi:hypothetical protein
MNACMRRDGKDRLEGVMRDPEREPKFSELAVRVMMQ